ncbi:MAG: CvpA family protein [Campylobacteraceae bacterium]
MEAVSWFDLICIIIIVVLGIKGIINGFAKEIFGLIGIIGGVFIASRYADKCGNFISENIYYIQNEASLFLLGFTSLFILTWIICLFIGFIFSKLLALSALTLLNRVLGFLIGSAKIFLVFAILFAALARIEFIKTNIENVVGNSFMYPILLKSGEFIINIKPEEIKDALKPIENDIKIELNDKNLEGEQK